ncbi:Ig-like domain-containing protein [Patescibacteria group bacterium]
MKFSKKTTTFILVGLLALIIAFLVFINSSLIPLKVINSFPLANTTHNPFNPVQLTFNHSTNLKQLSISMSPATPFYTSIDEKTNTLTISPQTQFQSLTDYTLSIKTNPPYILKFTTQRDLGNHPGWNEIFQQELDRYIKQYGDQNNALQQIRKNYPIIQTNFNITYSYSTNTYTVSLKPPYEQSKSSFYDWLNSQGIFDTSNLKINFIFQ